MIGDAYKSAAIQAVLGPAHSPVIPDVLHGAWLDGSLVLLGMTGGTVSHDDFGPSGDGVANTAVIDGGTCPASTPAYFAVYDAASGGDLVAYAPVTFDTAPSSGDSLTSPAGSLTFTYTAGA